MNTTAIGGGSSRGDRHLGAAPRQTNSHQHHQQHQFALMSNDEDDDDGTHEYNVDEMALEINHEGRTGAADDDREYVSDGNYTMNSSGVSSGRGGGVVLTQRQRRYGVPASSLSTPSSSAMNKSPTSSIAPSLTSSTPGSSRQSTGRRKNMMQRRIEMRRQQSQQQEEEKIRITQQQPQQPQMRLIRGLSLSSQSQSKMQYPRQSQHNNNSLYDIKNDFDDDDDDDDDDEDGINYFSQTMSHPSHQQYNDYSKNHPSPQGGRNDRQSQLIVHEQKLQQQNQKQYQFHNVQQKQQQQQQYNCQQKLLHQQSQSQQQYSIEQQKQRHQQRRSKYYSTELSIPNHYILSPPMLQRTGGDSRYNNSSSNRQSLSSAAAAAPHGQNHHIAVDRSRDGGMSRIVVGMDGEDDVEVQQQHVRFSFDGDEEEEDDIETRNYHDDIYYNPTSSSAVDRRINTNNIGVLNNVAGVNNQLRMLSQNNQYLHPRQQQQQQQYRQQSQQQRQQQKQQQQLASQHKLPSSHQYPRSKSEPRHRSSQHQSPSSNSVASIRKKWQDKAHISTNLQQHQEEAYQHEQRQCGQRGNSRTVDRWLNNRQRRDTNTSQHQVEERRSISAPRSDKYDDDAITPQDARRMLWDENERLLAVLPKHERIKLNDVRGRWLEHRTDDETEKLRIIHKSPSNTSQSSRRFKTKYLHAAALAQQRSCDSDDMNFSLKTQQQQPQREVNISSRHQRSSSQQHQQHEHQRQQHHQHQQQQHVILHKKKNSPVSSHYTDSTAETTADIMSTPDGSSNVSSPRNRAATLQNNSSSVLSNKVTPSPPKRPIGGGINHTTRDNSLAMPPIDEQAVVPTPTLQQQEQKSQTTSVANLIARINAVSRSDPQKALAAIDSIIQKEGGGVYGTDHQPNVVVRDHRGMNAPRSSSGASAAAAAASETITFKNLEKKLEGLNLDRTLTKLTKTMASASVAPQETFPSVPIVRRIVNDHRSSRSSGLDIPGVNANAPTNNHPLVDSGNPIVGNDILGHEESCCSLAAIPPGVRGKGGEFGIDDNDDSLLSSDESTVSSMTNPTYQSNSAQNAPTKYKVTPSAVIPATTIRPKPRTPPVSSTFQSKRDPPPVMSEQSWDVIKQKCTAVKAPTTYSIDNNTPDDELFGHLTPSHIVKDLEWMSDSHALEMSAWIPIPQNGDIFNNNTNAGTCISSTLTDNQNGWNKVVAKGWETTPKTRTQMKTMTTDDRLLDRILDTTYPSRNFQQQPQRQSRNVVPAAEIPPLQSLQSDADTFETPLPTIHHHKQQQPITPGTASLPEEIAKAFSDVDISFHEQQQQGNSRTVNERKKQLEYLSTTWVENYNNTHTTMNDTTNSSKKQSTSIASSSKSNNSSDFAGKLREKIKKVEPPIRLKGNRSLSQKFANLVNAFEL